MHSMQFSIPNTQTYPMTKSECLQQKWLCEYKLILSMYSESAYEKCWAHTVWHDLREGRSLQAMFDNIVIQLCPALSLQSGRPWIITLSILSTGGKRSYTPLYQTAVKKKKKKKRLCWNSCRARLGGFWRSKPEDNTLNCPETPQRERDPSLFPSFMRDICWSSYQIPQMFVSGCLRPMSLALAVTGTWCLLILATGPQTTFWPL